MRSSNVRTVQAEDLFSSCMCFLLHLLELFDVVHRGVFTVSSMTVPHFAIKATVNGCLFQRGTRRRQRLGTWILCPPKVPAPPIQRRIHLTAQCRTENNSAQVRRPVELRQNDAIYQKAIPSIYQSVRSSRWPPT